MFQSRCLSSTFEIGTIKLLDSGKDGLNEIPVEFFGINVSKAYEAIFIIPYGAKKRLTDDGWEFDSLNKLTADKINRLLDSLEITLIETYEDVSVYFSNGIKVSVFHDSTGSIEYVFCQVFDLTHKQTISEFCSNDSSLEFFKPA